MRLAAGDAAPSTVAEIGCGDGTLMLAAARRLAGRWPAVRLVLIDRLGLVQPRTLEAFGRLGWTAEPVVADVFDASRRARSASTSSAPTCSSTISRAPRSTGCSRSRPPARALFAACEPAGRASRSREAACRGARLQRRDAARRGCERQGGLCGARDLRRMAGAARRGGEGVARRAVHPMLHRQGRRCGRAGGRTPGRWLTWRPATTPSSSARGRRARPRRSSWRVRAGRVAVVEKSRLPASQGLRGVHVGDQRAASARNRSRRRGRGGGGAGGPARRPLRGSGPAGGRHASAPGRDGAMGAGTRPRRPRHRPSERRRSRRAPSRGNLGRRRRSCARPAAMP